MADQKRKPPKLGPRKTRNQTGQTAVPKPSEPAGKADVAGTEKVAAKKPPKLGPRRDVKGTEQTSAQQPPELAGKGDNQDTEQVAEQKPSDLTDKGDDKKTEPVAEQKPPEPTDKGDDQDADGVAQQKPSELAAKGDDNDVDQLTEYKPSEPTEKGGGKDAEKNADQVTEQNPSKPTEKSDEKEPQEPSKKKPPKLGPKSDEKKTDQSSEQQPSKPGTKDDENLAEQTPEQESSKPSGKADDKPEDQVDLTSVLNEEQRVELTLLIANLTESMRKLIIDNFDSSAGLNKSLLREGMSSDEKMLAADPNADVSEFERERKLKEQYDKDLASPKMKTLKKDALKAYDEWREQVIGRVGEVVNTKREKADSNAKAKPNAAADISSSAGKVIEAGNTAVNVKFKDLFPAQKTPLTRIPMTQRTLILHSLLLLFLSLEHYSAYSRILLLNVTASLKLPLKTFEQDEYTTGKGLLEAAKENEMSADEETRKRVEENKELRKRKVRIAAAAGAAILGVSGGLAAPLVAAGVGSVMGGLGLGATTAAAYLGSVAGSTVVVGGLFGAYGGRMTGQMMDRYAREVEDFQFLPVHGSHDKKTSEEEGKGAIEATEHDHKLRVTIGLSGWLTEKEEVVKPWRVLGVGAEVFALKYELEALLNLGNAMNGVAQSAAWGYAQKEIIQRTIFAELASALWPMALMKVARVIDNPFSVAKSRAEKAGEVLADALINRAQGERPVTLIGYSLGARVIYTCLMSLARRKQFGIVEHAVLIGSPTPSDTSDWRILRSVVAGRLVNVYSVNDYVLGFMYRTSAIQFGVAGLQKVEGLKGVENFDVSEDVSSHQRYRYLIGAILKTIGFEDIDMDAVEREREALVEIEKEEQKQSLASQQKWLMRRESAGGKEDEEAEAEAEANDLEKMVQEQTKKTLVTRAIEYFYMPNLPGTKDVDKMAGNVQNVAKDPTKVGDVAQDAQASASIDSLGTRLYKSLPSMPYVNRSTPAGAATDQAGKTTKGVTDEAGKTAMGLTNQVGGPAKGAADQKEGYISQASSYISSLRGSDQNQTKKPPKLPPTEKATESASKAANTGASAAKGAAGIAQDTVGVTVKNTLNPEDNPAVKSTKKVADNAPIIHQAKDRTPAPVKERAGEVEGAVETTVQNTGQTVQKGLDTTTEKAGDAGKAGVQSAQDAGKAGTQAAQEVGNAATEKAGGAGKAGIQSAQDAGKAGTQVAQGAGAAVTEKAGDAGKIATQSAQDATKAGQTYSSRAASYLPSVPRFGFGGAKGEKKPAPPKLEKRKSSAKNVQRPSIDKVPSGTVEKAKPPKLDRAPSGVKSPALPTKLDRVPSGVKSPALPTKLDRVPSGVKSPALPTKLDRVPSGVKSPPPKLGPRRTSSQQASAGVGVPSAASIGERLASIPSDATGAAKGVGEKGKSAVSGVKSPIAEEGKKAEEKGDQKSQDAGVDAAVETGGGAAEAVTATASGGAQMATDAGKGAAQAVTSTASQGAGKAADAGKGVAQGVGETAAQGAGQAVNAGKGAAQVASSTASQAAGTVSDAGKGAVQKGGNMLSGAGKLAGFGR
ncbi:hypothetical protein EDD37DRAFT_420628 [Exophiala viscosa]|uniref:uncharacterized protein n=1 Tax=Exophiala viscosa TaxID=2486360 RepID=UPI002195C12F|nr:hypothetical protein EDD37DRAFT_420628 [Exophiala viscosa]